MTHTPPRHPPTLNATAHLRGDQYAQRCVNWLNAHGIDAWKNAQPGEHDADAFVRFNDAPPTDAAAPTQMPIEIKSARAYSINRHARGYGFAIRRRGAHPKTAPVFILFCVTDNPRNDCAFIVPASELAERSFVAISGDPHAYARGRGKYARWYNALDVLRDAYVRLSRPNWQFSNTRREMK